nr:MAG TPA: hypothetical protein [Caudoviricetes sp.]
MYFGADKTPNPIMQIPIKKNILPIKFFIVHSSYGYYTISHYQVQFAGYTNYSLFFVGTFLFFEIFAVLL